MSTSFVSSGFPFGFRILSLACKPLEEEALLLNTADSPLVSEVEALKTFGIDGGQQRGDDVKQLLNRATSLRHN